MIDRLSNIDQELFLLMNSMHNDFLDPVIFFMTDTKAWLPLYIFMLYYIVKAYRKESWMILIGIAITILLADQLTTSFMKPFFARPRPSHEPSLDGLVHIVNGYRGGKYGFASSHAANTFGVATVFYLLFRRERWSIVIFLWAAFVGFTRIYLGVHYPGDIVVGGIIGALAGFATFRLYRWSSIKLQKRKTPSSE